MAEDVRSSEAVALPSPAPTTPAAQAETRSERARKTAYRYRFAAVYVLLAAVVGAGVGAFVVLVGGDDPAPAAEWSAWEPDGSRISEVRQIADRIPKAYRLPSGEQLVIVLGGPLSVPAGDGELRVGAIAVRPDTSKGLAEEDDIDVFRADKTISYSLCGLGQSCAIGTGEPSDEQRALLRRLALELSLYSFKYVDDVDSVVVFMPPNPANAEEAPAAIFLRRGDVSDELGAPLTRTLASPAPPVGGISERELSTLVRLFQPRVYGYDLQPSQIGDPILILTPPSAVGG